MYSLMQNTRGAARQTRTAFFVCLAFLGVSFSTSAWCQAPGESSSTGGDRCLAFIMTNQPGADASVPYGGVFPTLAEAQQDALNRCSQTNVAEEGWGQACRTWCVHR